MNNTKTRIRFKRYSTSRDAAFIVSKMEIDIINKLLKRHLKEILIILLIVFFSVYYGITTCYINGLKTDIEQKKAIIDKYIKTSDKERIKYGTGNDKSCKAACRILDRMRVVRIADAADGMQERKICECAGIPHRIQGEDRQFHQEGFRVGA